jgi:serine protease AprX
MPIADIRVRALHLAALALALGLAAARPSFAQDPATPEQKLDAVLRYWAERPIGSARVIVEFKGATPDVRAITRRNGRFFRSLPGQRGVVAEIDSASLTSLAADPLVARVSIDRPVFPTLARTAATVAATLARNDFGVDGRGVGIALIDSGIAGYHPDLYLGGDPDRTFDRIAHFQDLTPGGLGGSGPSDEFGHGTHVAGIILGSGIASEGRRTGIAPGAHLVVLKVLDAGGQGFVSTVIDAIDRAIAMKDSFNIRVINLSIAAGVFESHRDDPLTRAACRAVAAGIIVVAAAGNLGTDDAGQIQYGGITSPGNAPCVLTVGASSHQGTTRRRDDVVAAFSSRGPTAFDFAAKPDLVAPGVGTESAAAPYSTLATTHADYLVGGSGNGSETPYLSLTGTSMAAPVVTGTIALMLQKNPELTPNAVKGILQYTAQAMEGEPFLAQGAGLLNVAGAVRMAEFFADTEIGIGPASDVIEGEQVDWARHIIWGNYRVTGGAPLPGSNAWSSTMPWGAMSGRRSTQIVWGARTLDAAGQTRQSIIWATYRGEPITWASGARGNIIWATQHRNNIIWATGWRYNIIWATQGRSNIIWATRNRGDTIGATHARGNIIWATHARGNIIWATQGDDNTVWATAVAENVVWGDACRGDDCAAAPGARDQGVARAANARGNIIWATHARGNIIWATHYRSNIIWATHTRGNIIWATGTTSESPAPPTSAQPVRAAVTEPSSGRSAASRSGGQR